jgi:hypothetical protein
VNDIIQAGRRAGQSVREDLDRQPRSLGGSLRGVLRAAKAGAAAATAARDQRGARARFLEALQTLDAIIAEDMPVMTAAIHGDLEGIPPALAEKVTARLAVRRMGINQLAERHGLSLGQAATVLTEEGISGDAERRFPGWR